jgi:hypothetical protein
MTLMAKEERVSSRRAKKLAILNCNNNNNSLLPGTLAMTLMAKEERVSSRRAKKLAILNCNNNNKTLLPGTLAMTRMDKEERVSSSKKDLDKLTCKVSEIRFLMATLITIYFRNNKVSRFCAL